MICRIADDRLRGVKAIAEELGETERQARHGIDMGRIPAVKDGNRWCASREVLHKLYRAKMCVAVKDGGGDCT
jgi:hypothetical protein